MAPAMAAGSSHGGAMNLGPRMSRMSSDPSAGGGAGPAEADGRGGAEAESSGRGVGGTKGGNTVGVIVDVFDEGASAGSAASTARQAPAPANAATHPVHTAAAVRAAHLLRVRSLIAVGARAS